VTSMQIGRWTVGTVLIGRGGLDHFLVK